MVSGLCLRNAATAVPESAHTSWLEFISPPPFPSIRPPVHRPTTQPPIYPNNRNYKGSLTTPVTLYSGTAHAVDLGCGAGLVNWHVFKKAVPISPAQLAWATEAISSLPLVSDGLIPPPW